MLHAHVCLQPTSIGRICGGRKPPIQRGMAKKSRGLSNAIELLRSEIAPREIRRTPIVNLCTLNIPSKSGSACVEPGVRSHSALESKGGGPDY